MRILAMIMMAATLVLAGCEVPEEATSGTKPLPRIYRIGNSGNATVQFRMLDSVNALRVASGAEEVQLDNRLTAAAATHSRDMALQNRPWHFGSDGSSPLDRIARVGYPGQFLGETISETYETELETLSAWMEREDTRAIILDDRANHMGFAWYQEQSGKIWWTLVTGMAPELSDEERLNEILGDALEEESDG